MHKNRAVYVDDGKVSLVENSLTNEAAERSTTPARTAMTTCGESVNSGVDNCGEKYEQLLAVLEIVTMTLDRIATSSDGEIDVGKGRCDCDNQCRGGNITDYSSYIVLYITKTIIQSNQNILLETQMYMN